MKVEQVLKIELFGDDADNIKSCIKKLTKEMCVVGLKNNTITQSEHEAFIKLNETLNK